MNRRGITDGARAALELAAQGRSLAALGQSRVKKGGLSGAVMARATRGATVGYAADLGGATGAELADRFGEGLLKGVDFTIEQFATDAAVRADVTAIIQRGADTAAVERQLVRDVRWRSATRGAISGIPAVIPWMGTTIEIGAAIADSIAVIGSETRMILGLCHLRGLDVGNTERRRLDVMIILGLAAGAGRIEDGTVHIAGEDLDVAFLRDENLSHEVVVALGAAIAADTVRRIARRRTAGFILRLMPAGVSVVAAAWSDWRTTQLVGATAIEYLDLVHPAGPSAVVVRS